MVLLDIDEYIWPEYTPSPTEQGSPPTNKHNNDHNENDEERSLYESPQDRRSSLTATILPSHVPRFSRRTKVCAATWLVVVLLALVIGLLSLPPAGTSSQSAAAAFNNTTDSSSSQSNSSTVPQSPAESSSSGSHEEGGSSAASEGASNSTTPTKGIDDPCPLELAAAQACFVDEHDDALTTSSLTYISASVAQSVCEACMVQSWPTLNDSSEGSSALCGLDDDTACQELLLCECGSSCSGIVAAYLVCATSHSCHPSDDPEAWQSIPASCQQLLEVDPSQSSVDLLPPEISLEKEMNRLVLRWRRLLHQLVWTLHYNPRRCRGA